MNKIPSYRWQLGGIAVLGAASVGVISFLVRPGFVISHCGADTAFLSNCSLLWSKVIDGGFHSGFFLKAVVVASVLLMLLPERVYKYWKWFALISVPLAVWDIATTKTTLNMVGSSPQSTSNIDSLFFLAMSTSVALMAVFLGYEREHSFKNKYYQLITYILTGVLSLGVGIVIIATLFERFL